MSFKRPTTEDNDYSAFTQAGPIVWRSNRILIGRTEWRATVYRSERHDCRFVGYEWRRHGDWMWRRDEDHPNYDSDDGQYAGLPKGLRDLYIMDRAEIDRAMTQPEQEEMNDAA